MSCNILRMVILNVCMYICVHIYKYTYLLAGFTDIFCLSGNRQCGSLDPEVFKHIEINVFST